VTVIENARTSQRDPRRVVHPDAAESRDNPAHREHSGGGPGAKDRILSTANRLFYHEGIRAVGVDRLISESSVTKATFYKHFGAKETLVISYVQLRHEATRSLLTELCSNAPDTVSAIRAMVDNIVEQVRSRGFRGCAFINAATEFPDSHSPVREVVSAHRDWYTAFVADLFRRIGHSMPGDAADEFVLLRDGTMSGGYSSDPIAASAALQRCVNRLLAEAAA